MDLAAYADHEWLHSSWYFPGNNTLYALTHNEYHCDREGCPVWPNTGNLNFMSAVTLMQVGLRCPEPGAQGTAVPGSRPESP